MPRRHLHKLTHIQDDHAIRWDTDAAFLTTLFQVLLLALNEDGHLDIRQFRQLQERIDILND